MRTLVMSHADALAGRLMVGFVDACSAHPALVVVFFGLLLGLVLALWAELLQLRLDRIGWPGRRSGRASSAVTNHDLPTHAPSS